MKKVERLSLGIVCVIMSLGFSIIVLNILDVYEDIRINLSIPLFDTTLVFGVGLVVACSGALTFVHKDQQYALWLGNGVLALAAGSIIKSLLTGWQLGALITIYEGAVLFSSVLHLAGASSFYILAIQKATEQSRQRIMTALSFFGGTLAIVGFLTLLAIVGPVASWYIPDGGSSLKRDILRGLTSLFLLVSAGLYFWSFFKSQVRFFYWYALGLLLYACGVFFLSQGAVRSLTAWMGRISMYAGEIYLAIALWRAWSSSKKDGARH